MVVINPEECIDCGVCESECPAEAIIPDSTPGAEEWVALNKKYSLLWPRITEQKSPPPDADVWLNKPDKLAYLKETPSKD